MEVKQQTKKINAAQEEWYKNGELQLIGKYLDCYKNVISEMSKKKKVTILDVGGGAGYFSKQLETILSENIELEIYLLDTHKYVTWDDKVSKIHFIQGDALQINKIFSEKMFDYIFCNMIFHHLLGDSFKESSQIREKCLKNIVSVLKDDGKIGIIDNYNNGLLIDSISCRIIYALTNIRNPMIVRLCKRFGSNSAGVGVCMQSRKMWQKLIKKSGLEIIEEIDSIPDKLGLVKKLCLLNKSYSEFNLMVLDKFECSHKKGAGEE